MRRLVALSALLMIGGLLVAQPAAAARVRFPPGVASGDVTDHAAILWTKTNRRARLVAQVATDRRFDNVVARRRTQATAERGLTVEVEVTGLRADRRFFYRFVSRGGAVSPTGRFHTAPSEGPITFLYSGDSNAEPAAGFTDEIAEVFASARAERADFFGYWGDTMYSDSPPEAMTLPEYRAKYRQVRSIPETRALLAFTPLVAGWDDHEVKNDYAGNPDRLPVTNPADLSQVLDPNRIFPPGLLPDGIADGQRAFGEYFPVREGGETYRSIRYGDRLEVFVIDPRSYKSSPLPVLAQCDIDPGPAISPDVAPTAPQPVRSSFAAVEGLEHLATPPSSQCTNAINDPTRTMLGAAQKAWLMDGLQTSDAEFKVIVAGTPIQQYFALPYDRWEGYPVERAQLLTFIRDHVDGSVAFLTTDTHAMLVNEVCIFSPFQCGPSPNPNTAVTKEVVVGPIGTRPFAREIDEQIPVDPPGLPASTRIAAFFRAAQPNGLGMECARLNRFGYGLVEIRGDTMTVTPKSPAAGGPGFPVCDPVVFGGP
jgi:alkaline phosphatase D